MTENTAIFSAGIIAFLISGSELLFGKYKLNHVILLKKCRYLIGYSLLFGIIASLITWLIFVGQIRINEFELYRNTIVVSLCIGITIKSISRINIYTLTVENKKIPIGPKLIVDAFEDFILKKLQDDVDSILITEIKIVEKKLKKSSTLREMDEHIEHILPTKFSLIERKSYMKEISNFKNAFDKCRYIATNFGVHRLRMLKDELND